jgi:ABC-type oligopeptide transport system substrate-binding subunit
MVSNQKAYLSLLLSDASDSMIKKSLIALVGAVLLVAVLTAGCTSSTSTSSSPSAGTGQASGTVNPSAASSSAGDMGPKLISFVQSQGYRVINNVTKNEKAYGGEWDMYATQAKDSSGKQAGVVAKAFNSPSETADMYRSNVNSYTSKTYGYTVVTADNTKTTLKGPKGDTVVIYQDTADNMVVTIIPNSVSATTQAGT